MVERITDPHKPVAMTPGCWRIPDGHIVPNPPRPKPEPETVSLRIGVRSLVNRWAWAVVRALT